MSDITTLYYIDVEDLSTLWNTNGRSRNDAISIFILANQSWDLDLNQSEREFGALFSR